MMRGLWDREMVALLLIAALAPMGLAWLWSEGSDAVARLAFALVVAGAWHVVFMLARAQPPSLAGAITALAVAMLAPEDLGAFRLALGISFGVVFGELVFGGWGRNVVNPATVTLAFLGFGFPAFGWPDFVLPVAWAAIGAGAIGVALGVMPLGVIAGATLVGGLSWVAGLPVGPVLPAAAIALVLMVADPVASPDTALGRWLHGGLYGALVLMFATGWDGSAPVQICVAAALLASLAAPLFDEIAIALWVMRRRRRHGGP
ncbi:RnfABCDGE type electron transport complex subunit D [Roseibacterium sp. SDUM158017]|uniref:RnfABCDGE type electron transport complex subunit D n=1 Tax=Roseicyclus salinarum TaxID=3036773 RepID=UPI002414E033|nr:RnfABCDGE type electron transport complex subunit D [Roseibacterium sp. SDUM158017]MDG4647328.1 RnfABCDGE type electron transport complex subunit D [Roseibacterium sp. SDUM158017]